MRKAELRADMTAAFRQMVQAFQSGGVRKPRTLEDIWERCQDAGLIMRLSTFLSWWRDGVPPSSPGVTGESLIDINVATRGKDGVCRIDPDRFIAWCRSREEETRERDRIRDEGFKACLEGCNGR